MRNNTVEHAQNIHLYDEFVIFSFRFVLKNLLTFGGILYIITLNRQTIARCSDLNKNTVQPTQQQSDEELIREFLGGSEAAFEKLVSRYLGLISSAAKKYRGISGDADDNDLIQEGMVALLSACRSYDSGKGASFKNYLMLCVSNRYRSLMRDAARRGTAARNIVSIEEEQDAAFDPTVTSLPELVETKEYIDGLHRILKDSLSELEYKVAILHLSGYTYKEISGRLNISLKSVDNAQTRIRQKLSGNTPRREIRRCNSAAG
ncbi:MAG: sigma-70 family RNA polymerase sigma factor [Ruminococcus sp.]|nr:sigma-70 family RNA polymerase sigma factor [Ruminococcus sp.]